MADYPTRIDLCDGKYTLVYDFSTGQSECLRYGEPWRQLVGDKMVLACFDEIVELQQRVKTLREALTIAEGFVDRHSEPWYESGQRDLKVIREALAATEPK